MASPQPDEYRQARETIASLIEAPETARSALPGVVGLLDHEDHYLRLSAACGVCLVAASDADLVPYLVRRLLDRLRETDERAESVLAFEYLATQFPERVDETLQEIRENTDREPLSYVRSGGFRRSNIYSASDGADGVGRTRMAGEDRNPGHQQVYTADAEPVDTRARRDDETSESSREEADTDREAEEATGAQSEGGVEDPTGEDVPSTRGRSVPESVIDTVLEKSVFDDVTLLSQGDSDRFAEGYRMLGIVRGHEHAVDLRTFHLPESGRARFVAGLTESLRTWANIENEHVLAVHDWSREPDPWAAVVYADETLADRERLSLSEALWNARRLMAGVSDLHNSGIVHAGIEPRAVVYSGDDIDEDTDERVPPLLDNVGLLEPFRFAFDPADCLDPRYAAPEYFDRSYGNVDHATDIYQLGSVCYHLLTGQAPYDGEFDEIRTQVLTQQPPRPSQADETIPGILDQVVTKAMAKQKLNRYETVSGMEQDLLRAREHLRHNG